MEDLLRIIGIGLITCVAALVVKSVRPDISAVIAVSGGVIILLIMMGYLANVIAVFNTLVTKTGLNQELFGVVIKVIGVGYLTEFSAGICADTGNSSLGDKILLGGKLIILVMALPIITSIINIITELLP